MGTLPQHPGTSIAIPPPLPRAAPGSDEDPRQRNAIFRLLFWMGLFLGPLWFGTGCWTARGISRNWTPARQSIYHRSFAEENRQLLLGTFTAVAGIAVTLGALIGLGAVPARAGNSGCGSDCDHAAPTCRLRVLYRAFFAPAFPMAPIHVHSADDDVGTIDCHPARERELSTAHVHCILADGKKRRAFNRDAIDSCHCAIDSCRRGNRSGSAILSNAAGPWR